MKIRFTGKALDTVSYGGEKMHVVIDGVKPLGRDWVKEFPEDGRAVIYQRSHWEEVPEKHWRDVTAECEAHDYLNASNERMIAIVHLVEGGVHPNVLNCKYGYRLRKIERKDWGTYPPEAFIVEKSE